MSKRELVLKISMSADSFVAGTEGELDWLFPSMSPDAADWLVDTLEGASLHVMGSRTFKGMASWWPKSKEPFAAPMNQIPKAVFSSQRNLVAETIAAALADDSIQEDRQWAARPTALPINLQSWAEAKVVDGDLAEGISRLKDKMGSYILAHGGASFVRSLIAANLVDEYRLLVHPVVLGSGQPIFSALEKRRSMHLQDAKILGVEWLHSSIGRYRSSE